MHLVVFDFYSLRISHKSGSRLYGHLHVLRTDRSPWGGNCNIHFGWKEANSLRSTTCLLYTSMALLLIQTAPQLINPHYRNAKRFLGIASIIVALCNALILYNRVQESVAEIFAMPVLVAAQLQAALFTFIVLILFHSPYVCRRNILRHLCPTLFFVGLYLLTILLFPDVRIYSVGEYIANKMCIRDRFL